MNERIQELAEQARLWAEVSYKKQNDQFTSHWDTPIGYTVSQFFEQKFAELIVRECIEIVEPCKCGCCDGEPEGIITDTIIKQIKQHFGVER